MAEIASQGRVGEQGGGEAVVFDTSKFFQNVYSMQKDLYARQEQKRKEYAQQQSTWNALLEDMPDVWQADNEYVTQAVDEYNDFIIDLKSQGLDPEIMDTSLMKKMKGLENNVRKATSVAKDNETYYNQAFNILNQDKQSKYNKDYATQWLKDYADQSKSPQDRYKLRNESNPFKLNYDLIEFIDETIPDAEVVDSGRNKITSRNKEAHRGLVLDYIMNDEKGKEIYDSLKKPGETVDMFSERIAQQGQLKYPPKQDSQPAPQPRQTKESKGDEFKGGYGTGNWNDKFNISADDSAPNEYYSSGVNKIKVTRAGTNDDLPDISGLVDDGGSSMESYRPSVFYMGKDGKVSVFGYEYDNEGKVVDAQGKSIDYKKNKSNLESQMSGFDVEQEFANRRGAPQSGSAGSTNYTGIPTGGFNGN